VYTLNIITTFNSENKEYNFEEALRNKECFMELTTDRLLWAKYPQN
jgi:hypothetical protein